METKVKQRLMGVGVLIALAVIFIPMLFDNPQQVPNSQQISLETDIPTPPPSVGTDNVALRSQATTDAHETTNSQAALVGNNPAQQSAANGVESNRIADASAASPASTPASTVSGPSNPAQVAPDNGIAKVSNGVISQPTPANADITTREEHKAAMDSSTEVTTTASNKKASMHAQPIVKGAGFKHVAASGTVHNATTDKQKAKASAAIQQTGWAIQMGSFSSMTNADSLVKKLKLQGFTAYTQQIPQNNHSMVRVLVGPQAVRAESVKLVTKLQALNLHGVIVEVHPSS